MRQVPILMYHWFRRGAATSSRSPQLEVAPDLFRRQMRFLRERGYESVSLAAAFSGDAPGPKRPVVITFDDGTSDFWETGGPILEQERQTATMFVVSGRVGGQSDWDADVGEPPRRLMDWPQIESLARSGIEIGSHTYSHRVLPALDEPQAREELVRSRQVLADRLGTPPGFLAYPRGSFGEREKRLAREAGYDGACSVILGWRQLGRSDAYDLKRMTIKGTESMLHFRLRLFLSRFVRLESKR